MHHPRRLRPPAPDSKGSTTKRQNSLQSMVIKPSTIRIWIHDKDLGRLQKIVWEGMGDKLRTETSTNPTVRRFLNAVPYIMGSIREIHTAAINNDLELLAARSDDPVPKDILMSKDVNGLTPLHKAAGLGHMDTVREIIRKAPDSVHIKDSFERTPLHYAAALKDQGEMFQFLVDSGCVDHLEDKKGNTPTFYHSKPAELDGAKLLNIVPDAPRTAHIFPPSWDWKLLGGKDPVQPVESPQETLDVEEITPEQQSDSPVQSPIENPDQEEVEIEQIESPQSPPPPPSAALQRQDAETEDDDNVGQKVDEENVEIVEQEQEEIQQQQEIVSPRPDISEDEGVGSEVPVSGEEILSPQSDATNGN